MARKPRALPDETLQRIIALRERRLSWIKIQAEVNIDRRTAKRAYEDWQRTKSIDELKDARRGIAEEEFRNHLHFLVALAEALAQTLKVPSQPNVTASAADILKEMWETSRLREYSAYGVRHVTASVEAHSVLLASLKNHTSSKVRWEALNEWEKAWDERDSVFKTLNEKARGVVHNILEQRGLLQKVRGSGKKGNVEGQLVIGILHTVWEYILHPYDTKQFPILEIELIGGGRSRILFGNDKLVAGVVLDAGLCKEVVEVSRRAAKSMLSLPEVEETGCLVKTMRETMAELQLSLNPLLLGPQILSTRCDLCPA